MANLSQEERARLSGKSVTEVRRKRIHIYRGVKADGQRETIALADNEVDSRKGDFEQFERLV